MNMRILRATIRLLLTMAMLWAVWLMFSPPLDPYSLAMGLAGSFLVASVSFGVFIQEHEAARRAFIPRLPYLLIFLGRLVLQMYASSLRLLVAVITGRASPRIVHFRTRLKSDLGRIALCNAIGLTPGTTCLELDDDHLVVYWLFSTTGHSRGAAKEIAGTLENDLRRTWS